MEARIKTHGDELQKAYLNGQEYTKSFLQPEVRKSCFKALVDGWVNALDALKEPADSILCNEEEMPILSNYFPDEGEGNEVEVIEDSDDEEDQPVTEEGDGDGGGDQPVVKGDDEGS
ncbi:uncharacterized protein LOC115960746 [Quercus lobata]|uniref:uncharacterized protein LOC115960746 n=1 Tax=Quercus lobata TaxID=97700 RepID=UPI001243F7B7|nr:uncharacterized protein LOC115960746 [Quercus lobata]